MGITWESLESADSGSVGSGVGGEAAFPKCSQGTAVLSIQEAHPRDVRLKKMVYLCVVLPGSPTVGVATATEPVS